MARQVAERKRARREAARPVVEEWITKAKWVALRKADKLKLDSAKQTRQWKNESKFMRLNKPSGDFVRWLCVSWRH